MLYLLRLLSRSVNLVKVPRPHEVTDKVSRILLSRSYS